MYVTKALLPRRRTTTETTRAVSLVALVSAAWLIATPGAVRAAAANVEFEVRVVFELRANLARDKFADADIPDREFEVSQKLAQVCQARLKYWTFVAHRPTPQSPPAEARAPILRIRLDGDPDLRLSMVLEGPLMDDDSPWPATFLSDEEITRRGGVPGSPDLQQLIVRRFAGPKTDKTTLLGTNEPDIRKRLQRFVPIAYGQKCRYVGEVPPTDPRKALALLPLDPDPATHRYMELRQSQFRVCYEGPTGPQSQSAAIVQGSGDWDRSGLKAYLAGWEDPPGTIKPVDGRPPGDVKDIMETFAGLQKCRVIYLWNQLYDTVIDHP